MSPWNALWPYEARSQSANMCRQNRKSEREEMESEYGGRIRLTGSPYLEMPKCIRQ